MKDEGKFVGLFFHYFHNSLFVLYVMLNWTIVNVCQILLCMKSAICERSINFNHVRFHLS